MSLAVRILLSPFAVLVLLLYFVAMLFETLGDGLRWPLERALKRWPRRERP